MSDLRDDIQAFRHYLRAERGLADNTLLAYGRDLDRFAGWADDGRPGRLPRPDAARAGRLHRLPARGRQLAPPSVARHLVALKMFYRFLRLEERADADDGRAARLADAVGAHPAGAQPRQRRQAARRARTPRDRFYLRDRALLETLYATGSRASEVVGLKLADLHLDAGFCKCFGKGSKQRVVPLGPARSTPLRGVPGASCGRRWCSRPPDAPWVFVSRGGKPLTREMLWVLVKKYVKRAGLHTQGQPAHAAAQLRDAPARRRGRPADRAGAARPRQHPHDAALHARRPRPAEGDPPAVPPARRAAALGRRLTPRSGGRGWLCNPGSAPLHRGWSKPQPRPHRPHAPGHGAAVGRKVCTSTGPTSSPGFLLIFTGFDDPADVV